MTLSRIHRVDVEWSEVYVHDRLRNDCTLWRAVKKPVMDLHLAAILHML